MILKTSCISGGTNLIRGETDLQIITCLTGKSEAAQYKLVTYQTESFYREQTVNLSVNSLFRKYYKQKTPKGMQRMWRTFKVTPRWRASGKKFAAM